jgi:protein-L-isoaspartate(D-aspartate) O-methyltransferase
MMERAYDDSPFPIGYGQTISQPYIVALTTVINPGPGQNFGNRNRLRLSGGSFEIVDEVYTIDNCRLSSAKN